jgi:hypothetical protein
MHKYYGQLSKLVSKILMIHKQAYSLKNFPTFGPGINILFLGSNRKLAGINHVQQSIFQTLLLEGIL